MSKPTSPACSAGDTLGALLRGWADLVTRVERGYDDSIYEYTNDLSVRDRLERLVQGAGRGCAPSSRGRSARTTAASRR